MSQKSRNSHSNYFLNSAIAKINVRNPIEIQRMDNSQITLYKKNNISLNNLSNYNVTPINFNASLSITPFDSYLNGSDPEDVVIAMHGVFNAIAYFSNEIKISTYVNETEFNMYEELYFAAKAIFFANYFLQSNKYIETNDSLIYPQLYLNNQTDCMVSSYILVLFRYVNDILLQVDEGNDIYLIAAQKVLNSFNKSIEEGGMHVKLSDTEWWYPHHEQHRFVLNGHIITLINLYNYYYRTADLDAYKYFSKGVNGTERLIAQFISGSQQFYDLVGNKANYKYQSLHTMLLDWLYSVTGIGLFRIYHDIFLESYILSTESEIEMIANKNNTHIELQASINWNIAASGDNRLYTRHEMTFEGYYSPISYVDIDINIIFREEKEEDVSGFTDPNSYSIQRRLSLDSTTYFDISDIVFDINYLYLQLPSTNIILSLFEEIQYQNRWLEIGVSVSVILLIYVTSIITKKIKVRENEKTNNY